MCTILAEISRTNSWNWQSTHIPYRDSKLTRILQESLGGNSRTTLIINCSPSTSNEAETISTLRFGTRAKCIKNKAKVNVELSTGDLKKLLKAEKLEVATLQGYVAALEAEVNVWRNGGSVSNEDRAALPIFGSPRSPLSPLTSATGSLVDLTAPMSLPRALATASLLDDDRDEFMLRENELQDQITGKEMELNRIQADFQRASLDLTAAQEKDVATAGEIGNLRKSVSEMQVDLERVKDEAREAKIEVESLKETERELRRESEGARLKYVEMEVMLKDLEKEQNRGDERIKMKEEMMRTMLKGLGVEVRLNGASCERFWSDLLWL